MRHPYIYKPKRLRFKIDCIWFSVYVLIECKLPVGSVQSNIIDTVCVSETINKDVNAHIVYDKSEITLEPRKRKRT